MKQSSPETKTRPSPSPGTRAGKGRAAPSVDSPWSGTPDREQQREAKRQAVLQAAAQLFNERGFSATSLDDIAARLGVSKPTLYYYVKNKDEILLQCVNQGLAMTLEGIEASRRAGGQAVDQLPPAPALFSTITEAPSTLPSCCANRRFTTSAVPPGGNGTIRRMGSAVGQPASAARADCAGARAPRARAAGVAERLGAMKLRRCMRFFSSLKFFGTSPGQSAASHRPVTRQ